MSDLKNGAKTRLSTAMSLINMLSEGPLVSLSGSPTVSPMTAALCASLPLPPSERACSDAPACGAWPGFGGDLVAAVASTWDCCLKTVCQKPALLPLLLSPGRMHLRNCLK